MVPEQAIRVARLSTAERDRQGNQDSTEQNHRASHYPWPVSRGTPESIAGDEHHRDGDRVGYPQRHRGVVQDHKRQHDRDGGHEYQQEDRHCPKPILSREPNPFGLTGQARQPEAYSVEIGRSEDRRHG